LVELHEMVTGALEKNGKYDYISDLL